MPIPRYVSSTVRICSRYKDHLSGEYVVSEEILINVTPRETRVGVVENGMLQEVHVERASKRGYVGNVYKGRVQRVMPGMQAVFVEIGLERAAFLHASDIVRPPQPVSVDGVESNGNGTVTSPRSANWCTKARKSWCRW